MEWFPLTLDLAGFCPAPAGAAEALLADLAAAGHRNLRQADFELARAALKEVGALDLADDLTTGVSSRIEVAMWECDEVAAVERFFRLLLFSLEGGPWLQWSPVHRASWVRGVHVYASGWDYHVVTKAEGGSRLVRSRVAVAECQQRSSYLVAGRTGADDPLDEDQQRVVDALAEGADREVPWLDRNEDAEETRERFRQAWWDEHFGGDPASDDQLGDSPASDYL